jgi:regulator of replication initiation timing
MWFCFPAGVTQINVQQQLFVEEIKDKDGRSLFRAPDHFAAIILDQPGFSVPAELPKNAPEDLPKSLDPEISNEVASLAGQLRQKDFELDNLQASLSEVSMERDSLRVELREVKTELENLKAEGEEKENKSGAVLDSDEKKKPGFADSVASARDKR